MKNRKRIVFLILWSIYFLLQCWYLWDLTYPTDLIIEGCFALMMLGVFIFDDKRKRILAIVCAIVPLLYIVFLFLSWGMRYYWTEYMAIFVLTALPRIASQVLLLMVSIRKYTKKSKVFPWIAVVIVGYQVVLSVAIGIGFSMLNVLSEITLFAGTLAITSDSEDNEIKECDEGDNGMNEYFKSFGNPGFTIGDNGIEFKGEIIRYEDITHIIHVFEAHMMTNGVYQVNVRGSSKAYTLGYSNSDKERANRAFAYAIKRQQEIINANEHRMKCNVCGHVYCYTDADLQRNVDNYRAAASSYKASAWNFFGGTTVGAYADSARGDKFIDAVVDYTKCPKCSSHDIKELTAEVYKYVLNEARGSTISNADELRKFKDLLDSGVITQQEFDAKKKQLLGL